MILVGSITWSLTMVRSGLTYSFGIGFWGANGHDGIWHIALIKSLAKGNFQMPIFSGWGIQNYHIGFDLLLSYIVRFTKISPSFLYFQIVPPLLALFIGFLTYKFVYLWRKSEGQSLLAVFFVYFGGSFGWLISLISNQGWGGESMFWSQQSISTLINPPFALSLIIILAGLIYLKKYLEKKLLLNFCLTVFFFGISIFIKVYAGLLVLISILVASIWQVIKKKNYSLLGITLVSGIISLLLFLPFNKSSANLISFNPFWFLQTMLIAADRLDWQKLYSAMTTYASGHIWIKAVLAYGLAFIIFILGNFGTRIIALKSLFKKPKKLLLAGPIEIFIFTLIAAGITVPMLFTQKGTAWNTIQFLYYSLIFAGIVAGIEIDSWVNNLSLFKKSLIIIVFVLITIPTTIASMDNYFPVKPQSMLPTSEVEALKFLSTQPDGVVLTYPFDADKALAAKPPRPLYLYTSTAYVSAFSGKTTFLEDQINLDIMQYPWQERRASVEDFLNMANTFTAQSFLKENDISYVYWITGQHAKIPDVNLSLMPIFKNSDVTIFKVK